MTMEKESKRHFFSFRKSHSQNNVAVDNASLSSSQQDVAFQPDAAPNGEFVEKDVNVTSVFGPFIKNYVSNLSHHQVN